MQPLAISPRVKQRRRSELGLLIVAVVVLSFAYLLASLGAYNVLPANALEFIGIAAALALVVHLANRYLAPEADPVIMPVVLMLNGIGFVMIYPSTTPPRLPGSPLGTTRPLGRSSASSLMCAPCFSCAARVTSSATATCSCPPPLASWCSPSRLISVARPRLS